jgi:hypothetical protein
MVRGALKAYTPGAGLGKGITTVAMSHRAPCRGGCGRSLR